MWHYRLFYCFFFIRLINHKRMLRLKFTCIILFWLALGSSLFAQSGEIDDLKNQLSKATGDSMRSVLNRKISLKYYSLDNQISAQYAENARATGKKAGNKNLEGLALQMMGFTYEPLGRIDEALEVQKLAIELLKDAENYKGVVVCCSGAAYCLEKKGKLDEALEIVLYSLKVIDEQNLGDEQRAKNLVDLARIYRENNQLNKSISVYEEALKISLDKGDHSTSGVIYMNMGNVYSQDGDYKKALSSLSKSLEQTELCNCKGRMTAVWSNIGYAQYNLGDGDAVLAAAHNADSLWLDRSNKEVDMDLNCLLGMGNQLKGDNAKAMLYLEKAMDLARETNFREKMIRISTVLAKCYAALGEKNKLEELLTSVIRIKDSTYNEGMAASIADMQIKYETQKKENDLDRLETASRLNEAKLSAARWRNIFLILMVCTALVIAAMSFRLLQRSRKDRELLSRQNKELAELLDQKKLLLKEIHHRIKNNLQTISSLLNLQTRASEDEIVKKAMLDGQGRLKSISLLHQKLYLNDTVSTIAMQEYIEDLCDYIVKNFNEGNKKVHLNIDAKDISLDMDTAIPLGLILNELVTNTMKHAFNNLSDGEINITLNHDNEQHGYVLELQNNGTGLPDNLEIESLPSMGLRLVKNLSRQLRGNLKILSSPKQSFVVQFRETISA
ncbi:MAG: tetratricopeptide repeat protein [Bacteroidetes bacterium]|nr:tetratricopeptide repeat protein [Bacteroidota bacterium]